MKWITGIVVLLCLALLLYSNAAGASSEQVLEGARFAPDPTGRVVVQIDESWAAPAAARMARAVEAPSVDPAMLAHAGTDQNSSWWSSLPRTSASMYESFAVMPQSLQSRELFRNQVLNPDDIEIEREVAEAFSAWYGDQLARVKEARKLVEQGRMALVQELIASGQLVPMTAAAIADKVFVLKDGQPVLGAALMDRVRESVSEDADEVAVVITALSWAGEFDAGDTFTIANQTTYLLPFERVQEGIPTVVALEREVTRELVVRVHRWFQVVGVLPNADELLEVAVPKIVNGPR